MNLRQMKFFKTNLLLYDWPLVLRAYVRDFFHIYYTELLTRIFFFRSKFEIKSWTTSWPSCCSRRRRWRSSGPAASLGRLPERSSVFGSIPRYTKFISYRLNVAKSWIVLVLWIVNRFSFLVQLSDDEMDVVGSNPRTRSNSRIISKKIPRRKFSRRIPSSMQVRISPSFYKVVKLCRRYIKFEKLETRMFFFINFNEKVQS